MKAGPAPIVVLSVGVAFAAMLAVASLFLALNQPWLGLTFTADDGPGLRIAAVEATGPSASLPPQARVVAMSDGTSSIELEPFDIVEEPDVAASYADLDRFLSRQEQIATILRSGSIALSLSDGTRITVNPAPGRPVTSLPPMFWGILLIGILSVAIGGWTLAFRPGDTGARLLALCTIALLFSSFPATVYMHRELALAAPTFRILSSTNIFGSLSFVVGLLALFLYYPRRLAGPMLPIAIAATVFAIWLVDAFRLPLIHGPGEGRYLTTVIVAIGALVAAGVQYWQSRREPLQRAAILWLAMSVGFGVAVFLLVYTLPILAGEGNAVPSSAGYALMLPIFVGIGIGVARYRLFELETWAFRILFYLLGAAILVILDLGLLTLLAMDRIQALGLSLGVVALLYLPLRDFLSGRLLPRSAERPLLLRAAIDVALAATPRLRNERWQQLLVETFHPLRLDRSDMLPARVQLARDGLELEVPGYVDLQPLRLAYADGGRRLFSPRDLGLLDELYGLLVHAMDSRHAFERGAMAERGRIARDMHDNIGAKLLSALHSTDPERKETMVRETMSDLRNILNNLNGTSQSLDEALAELRLESAERLSAAGLSLDWHVGDWSDESTSPLALHTLRSVLREAISNAIRHAGARTVRVDVARDGDRLTLSITDDGKGMAGGSDYTGGMGLLSMQNRLAALGGTLSVANATPGVRLVAEFTCAEGQTA